MENNGKRLASCTTLRIGGAPRRFIQANHPQGLLQAVEFLASEGIPWKIIGGGSNILFPDEGTELGIIQFEDPTAPQEIAPNFFRVSAGFSLDRAVSWACQRGLSGLENLAGIPGTIGGAVYGNAGAYGSAIGDIVEEVSTSQGTLTRGEMDFSYRSSALKKHGGAILSVILRLRGDEAERLLRISASHRDDRAAKHPDIKHTPSAGSWFQNIKDPQGNLLHAAGKLLEEAGCKGLQVGGASLWHKHANIVVTDGRATAQDIKELTSRMKERVQLKFGIELREEVCVIER